MPVTRIRADSSTSASDMPFSKGIVLLLFLCVGTVFGQSRPQIEDAAGSIFGRGCELRQLSLSLGTGDVAALDEELGGRHQWQKVDVYAIEKAGRISGVFMVDNVKGKSRPITYAVAFDRAGSIVALEILAYRESHGGEVRSEMFRSQFEGKKHGDALAVGRDIRNISGATISSRAVTAGARALATLWHHLKEKGTLE